MFHPKACDNCRRRRRSRTWKSKPETALRLSLSQSRPVPGPRRSPQFRAQNRRRESSWPRACPQRSASATSPTLGRDGALRRPPTNISLRSHALTLDLARNEKLQVLDQGIDLAQIFAAALSLASICVCAPGWSDREADAAARAITLRRVCSSRAPPGFRPDRFPGGPHRREPWSADRAEAFPIPIPATCAGEVSLDLRRTRLCLIVVIVRLQPAPVLPCPRRTALGRD